MAFLLRHWHLPLVLRVTLPANAPSGAHLPVPGSNRPRGTVGSVKSFNSRLLPATLSGD